MADVTFGSVREIEPGGAPAAPRLAVLWRRWNRARRDRAALAAMDERARRDVGITPADIREVYRRPWWRWPLT